MRIRTADLILTMEERDPEKAILLLTLGTKPWKTHTFTTC